MKICMLVSRVPWPLEKGDKLRAYHQVKQLSKRHEVHLLCLSDSIVDERALTHLRSITPHVHVYRLVRWKIWLRMLLALFSRKPFQVHYFFDSAISRQLVRTIETIKPDVIYCQLIRCSEYVKHLHHYIKAIDYMDALSAGQQRRAQRAPWYLKPFVKEECRRLMAYEHLIFDYFEYHSIISEQDQKLIYHAQSNRIQIVPNGIDSVFFQNSHSTNPTYDVVFTGNMSYPPNVEGAQRLVNEVLPLVRKTHPTLKVLLAGANPSGEVVSLQSDSVHVSGWMDDIRDAYKSARILVAPMVSGSGMQNKLLEAMCMGLPCVTTPLAAAPLSVKHREQCLIGDTNEALAECISELLENRAEADRIGREARRYVESNFNWESTVALLESGCFPITNSNRA